MAEHWQKWMPFHIDKFRGSPEVQAMHPCGRIGYLYLLASAWQTSDCTISCDPIDLATESGLGDELWVIHGPRILRSFYDAGEGRLQNRVVFAEWTKAKEVFEARRARALRGHMQKAEVHMPADEGAYADTVTSTQTLVLNTPLPPLKGGLRSRPPRRVDQRQAATAAIGMSSDQRGGFTLEDWRAMRDQGSQLYRQHCPADVRLQLAAESARDGPDPVQKEAA